MLYGGSSFGEIGPLQAQRRLGDQKCFSPKVHASLYSDGRTRANCLQKAMGIARPERSGIAARGRNAESQEAREGHAGQVLCRAAACFGWVVHRCRSNWDRGAGLQGYRVQRAGRTGETHRSWASGPRHGRPTVLPPLSSLPRRRFGRFSLNLTGPLCSPRSHFDRILPVAVGLADIRQDGPSHTSSHSLPHRLPPCMPLRFRVEPLSAHLSERQSRLCQLNTLLLATTIKCRAECNACITLLWTGYPTPLGICGEQHIKQGVVSGSARSTMLCKS